MISQKLANFLYFFMIILVIAFCIFIYFYLTGQSRQCLADPIEFYQKAKDVQCYCTNGFGFVK